MRTITKEVYTYDELSDIAKQMARFNVSCNFPIDLTEENEGFSDLCHGMDLSYHMGEERGQVVWAQVTATYRISDAEESLAGVRAWKWIEKHWLEEIVRIPKVNKYYHHYDYDWFLEQYWNANHRRVITDNMSVSDVIQEIADAMTDYLQFEFNYQISDEYIEDIIDCNSYEFYEDGEMY